MKPEGRFILWPGEKRQIIVPNSWMDDGTNNLAKIFLQAQAQGSFYVGLTNAAQNKANVLANMTEPTTGGYARLEVERTNVGWPTLDVVNGVQRAQSKLLTFTASGADYNLAVDGLFLCNAVSGTVGILFCQSAQFPAAITVLDGESLPVIYELYFRNN